MIKLRVQGTLSEVEKTVEKLKQTFNVSNISKKYKNQNSEYYMVYIDLGVSSEIEEYELLPIYDELPF